MSMPIKPKGRRGLLLAAVFVLVGHYFFSVGSAYWFGQRSQLDVVHYLVETLPWGAATFLFSGVFLKWCGIVLGAISVQVRRLTEGLDKVYLDRDNQPMPFPFYRTLPC